MKYTHFLVLITITQLLYTVNSLSTNEAMRVMIKGRDEDQISRAMSGKEKNHINHKLLRANIQEKKLTPLEQKLYDYEQQIRRYKLKAGDNQIKQLKNLLSTIKVYEIPKVVEEKKKKEEKKVVDLTLLKYQPEKLLGIQSEVNKRDHSKNGPTLNDLLKHKDTLAVNPFKKMIDLQTVIEDSNEMLKKNKLKEQKELDQQFNRQRQQMLNRKK